MKKLEINIAFRWGVLLLNVLLAVYATPITDYGDAGAYIRFSQMLSGEQIDFNFAHRSPLYPILMAGFMSVIESEWLFDFMVLLQYVMVAATTMMLFELFKRLLSNWKLAMLAAALFNLSLSTIYFANIMLTEILTVFLLVTSLSVLFAIYQRWKWYQYAMLGSLVGLLMLARFNTVPLLITYLLLIGLILYQQKCTLKQWVFSALAFITPLAFILNAWCFYNLSANGFYGLFPRSGQGVPRNITVASIHPGNEVSGESKEVLDIFLEARADYYSNLPKPKKGSLASFDRYNILTGLYGGFDIYGRARPKLLAHFELQEDAGEYELSQLLSGFYREIASQNSSYIQTYRVLSFLSSFRVATSGVLPDHYGSINLNILPAFVIIAYKLGFVLVSATVFLAFLVLLWRSLRQRKLPHFYPLALFIVAFSFWGINFVFVTAADANRYKFPAEPLVIGLFVWTMVQLIGTLRNKFSTRAVGALETNP
jgi:4-amino-4-deoxy-L-arabinose transferase-like glycosyltransferase